MNNKNYRIKELIHNELLHFPKSNLIDIHKLFYQGTFGPAHFLTNLDNSKKYLRKELDNLSGKCIIPVQDISFINTFFRIDLRWAREYFDFEQIWEMFQQSIALSNNIEFPDWIIEWQNIVSILKTTSFKFNYQDEVTLMKQFRNEEYLHHSPLFKQEHQPHYRVITKDSRLLRFI